eukprot:1144703-Pelagomonas_calceolata.AAC.13
MARAHSTVDTDCACQGLLVGADPLEGCTGRTCQQPGDACPGKKWKEKMTKAQDCDACYISCWNNCKVVISTGLSGRRLNGVWMK